MGDHWAVLGLLMLVMSMYSLCLMGVDKGRAIRKERRISQRTLWLAALLGGGIGGTLGMWIYRHKTRHWYFRHGFPLVAILDGALLIWAKLG